MSSPSAAVRSAVQDIVSELLGAAAPPAHASWGGSLTPDDRAESKPAKHSRAEQARINGAKSRGPISDEGKARSSRNATTHGLCAESLSEQGLLVPGEDPAEYAAFVRDFRTELHAAGTLQCMLADRAADLAWKLKRFPVIESAVLGARATDRGDADPRLGGMGEVIAALLDDEDTALQRLQRYETRIQRAFHHTLRELRVMQGYPADARAYRDRASFPRCNARPQTCDPLSRTDNPDAPSPSKVSPSHEAAATRAAASPASSKLAEAGSVLHSAIDLGSFGFGDDLPRLVVGPSAESLTGSFARPEPVLGFVLQNEVFTGCRERR